MSIANNIKRLRKYKGLSQRELGERAELPDRLVSQYENQRRCPSLKTARKLKEALEATWDELLG